MSVPRLTALFLFLITLVIYLPVTRSEFLNCDDTDYVASNAIVQQGLTWDGVKYAFTTFDTGNWHPLTWLSHMAVCEFFHLHAGAHHLVNVLFHAANAALLFVLLWRLTGLILPAALVAALFAWHPLHVESVAWVAERKDVLSTFFGLLALLSYAKFVQQKDRRSFWFSSLFFALSLLAKPMLVTLPFVLLLLDFWPLQRMSPSELRWSPVWEKWPFFALTAGSSVVSFLAQRSGHAVVSLSLLPMHFRFENAAVAAMRYLLKMLWPADLAIVYPYGPIPGTTVIIAIAVLALISGFVWHMRDRNRCWLTGWSWFLGTLVPVIGLVQVGVASMADRYSYFPSIGIFMAVAFGLYHLPLGKMFLPLIAAVSLVACAVSTEKQLAYWRNSETVFRHAVAIMPDNQFARINLAAALDADGRPAEALDQYNEALHINPLNYQVHYAAGKILARLGRPTAALDEYRQCLRLMPDSPVFHDAAAGALAAQGNFPAALSEFAKAEQLAPHFAQPHLDLARLYFERGLDNQAANELRVAVRVEPNNFRNLITVARYLAANTNDAVRNGESALALALQANTLSGERIPDVFDVLGMAFAATGDFTNAVTCAQNALEFLPDNSKVAAPIQERLQLYQNHQPWRESFRSTNAPPEQPR